MPFGLLPDQVYAYIIAPALRSAGYDPKRADTTFNQRAIMQDVIAGIKGADLVVADLTSRNANVFYELGLAHSMRRPTVMIAQSTDDIPFDLQAYRVVIYALEFASNGRLTSSLARELVPLVQAARDGSVEYGNPFTDYAVAPEEATVASGEPDEGILEIFDAFNTQAAVFGQAMAQIGTLTQQFASEMGTLTIRINAPEPGHELENVRTVTAEMGALFDRQASHLEPIVDEQLAPMALQVEAAARALVRLSSMGEHTPADDERLQSIRTLSNTAHTVGTTLSAHAAQIRQLSGIATASIAPGRRLAAVTGRIAAQLDRVAGLADALLGPEST